MVRPFVAALIVVAAMSLSMRPAQAAVTASISINGPANYTGLCPTTMSFSGTISGAPGTQVTYSWNRFINSSQQVASGATVTLGASPYAVSDSIKLIANASGTTFDQLWVHNISGGQPDVYSNKVTFSVTCAGATPNPMTVLHQGTTLIRPAVTLHSLEWTWRSYTYEYVGFMSTYVPEFGTGPCTNLCVGWIHVKNGDSGWLYHHNSFERSWLGFANTVKTLHATKALLALTVVGGDPGCLGGVGMGKGPWPGVSQHDFKTGAPTDADFTLPATSSVNGSTVTFDVTSIVQAWESGHSNDGFVVRSRTEDNGSDGNDSCSLSFGTDGVLTIQQ
jgi:hypothetical protein